MMSWRNWWLRTDADGSPAVGHFERRRVFRLTDAFGTVEVGKTADLVLLEANPLSDIRNTRKIAAVILAGRFIGKPELQQMLRDVETAARNGRS